MAVLLFLHAASVGPGNCPAWRGPTGDGVCLETNVPTRWGRTERVRWRTEPPEPGNSTPVVWGDRIFFRNCRRPIELLAANASDLHTLKTTNKPWTL